MTLSYRLVHDSFGVHACDIDALNRALREEFVRIYSEPILLRFFKEQWEANPNIYPKPCNTARSIGTYGCKHQPPRLSPGMDTSEPPRFS